MSCKGDLDEDSGLAAIETLDTLDSLLLSGIAEIEQLERQEVSVDELGERLRQIWQRSYAHYAAREENRLQVFFLQRGRALKTRVYPTAYQRRRLYRTGLPPRSGNQLLGLYPSFKAFLEKGEEYARWNPQDRLNYIQTLVEQLTSLPQLVNILKCGPLLPSRRAD